MADPSLLRRVQRGCNIFRRYFAWPETAACIILLDFMESCSILPLTPWQSENRLTVHHSATNDTRHGLFVLMDVKLELGGRLAEVELAYVSRGKLSADGSNAVLVTHGYTSGQNMIEAGSDVAEGSWDAIVGPGMPVDTNRLFVVCSNTLGSSFGSTNASSTNPGTGTPYGSSFPDITLGDIVHCQRALLDSFGVRHLVAVIGPSFGGAQVFQWGVDYPDFMDGLVPVVSGLSMANANPTALEAELAAIPQWHGGDYYGRGDLTAAMTAKRIKALHMFGADAVLAARFPDPDARTAELARLARAWAERFDANSLLILSKAMARYNVISRVGGIRAPVLYVLSRSDKLFPPSLGVDVMTRLYDAGVSARYFEIDSEAGHAASGTDADKWAPALSEFFAQICNR
jgi:homoserine O-acetyltransferase/O-succinyltransferase